MPGPGILGSGIATGPGTHLYHETKDAVIAHTAAEVEKYVNDGYSTDYIHREYPKVVNGKTVKSLEEELAVIEEAKTK